MRRCSGCFKEIDDELELCPYCGFVEGSPAEEAVHMHPGTILNDRYIIGKVIGFGGFGVTYVAWDGKLEQKVAIKEYLPSEFSTRMPGQSQVTVFTGDKSEQYIQGLNKFVDEAKRLAKFTHEEGIVRILDCISANDTAYIVMEYLEGETLTDYLKREKRIPEDKAVEMLMPIMHSLKTVHEQGILHRDIAPDNIFITKDGQIKLIDFGASRFATTSHSRSLTVIVKPGYSAEEQYRSRGDQGPHTDVYSLAATLYKMITGVTPPDALERRVKIENAKKDIITDPRKIDKGISVRRENAIMNALNIRIEDRTPTIDQFIKELESDPAVPRRYGKIKKIDFYTWPLWLKVAAPILAVAIITFGVLLATGVISFKSFFISTIEVPEGYSVVPEVKGVSNSEAQKQVEAVTLNYFIEEPVISEYLDAGTVVLQEPRGGVFAPINSNVAIKLSQGNGNVTLNHIPFFTARPVEDLMDDLTSAGFSYDQNNMQYEYSNVAEGLVTKLVFNDGSQASYDQVCPDNTFVIIYVSKGPEPIEMPNLVGLSEKDAVKLIIDSGLAIDKDKGISHEENSSVKTGVVFAQSVEAKESVVPGTVITLKVSTGAPTTTTQRNQGGNQGSATKAPTKTPTPTNTPTPTPLPILTVTFDSNGGSSVSSISRTYGEKLGTLPTPTKKGHTFEGWMYNSTKVSSATTVKKNITLVASWSANTYTISFDSKGGSSVSSITRKYGESLGNLTSPKRDYYTFNGWYNGSNSVNSGTTVTGDMSLKASWTENGWGSWSSWSRTSVSEQKSGDLLIVQVEKKHHDATYTYKYKYTRYNSTDGAYWCGPWEATWGGHYCWQYQEKIVDSKLQYKETQTGYGTSFNVYWDGKSSWFNEQEIKNQSSAAYDEYRYRTRIK